MNDEIHPIQPRGVSDLAHVRQYIEFEAEFRRQRLAAFNLPAYLLQGDQGSGSYAAAKSAERDSAWMLPRESPAVKMANRSLPNPNGENQL